MSMSKGPLVLAALFAVGIAAACTKTDPAAGTSPSATTTPSPPIGSATATMVPSASANPELAVSGSPMNTAVVATASSSGTKPVSSASAGTTDKVECGTKPQPDCPLQAWMKANMNPPVSTSDGPALATAMEQSVKFAPSGYSNWVSIAKDGAKAAKEGNIDAAKQACRGCHDQYKKKYQTEMRGRKI